MRWLSSFAILVYLSLLCSPQALAVHDSRVSPLADTQLQGLNPAIYSAFNQTTVTADDTEHEPPVGIIEASNTRFSGTNLNLQPTLAGSFLVVVSRAHQPRAPPVLSSH